ncbi:hypothetical protein A8A54_15575 [Brucella pseudogrignonensis]|nr:hypothetical protein A8A54_15575 [Brucella pseudogrignonensis]
MISDYVGMIVRLIFVTALMLISIIKTTDIGWSMSLYFISNLFLSIFLLILSITFIISFCITSIRIANKVYNNDDKTLSFTPTAFIIISIGALIYILVDYAHNDTVVKDMISRITQ